MIVRTPADLGALIRDRRKELALGQAELARRIGATRQWVISIEKGRSRAEIGLVLRALDALGIRIDSKAVDPTSRSGPNIDQIVANARKRPT